MVPDTSLDHILYMHGLHIENWNIQPKPPMPSRKTVFLVFVFGVHFVILSGSLHSCSCLRLSRRRQWLRSRCFGGTRRTCGEEGRDARDVRKPPST